MPTTKEEVLSIIEKRGILFNTIDDTTKLYERLVIDILQIVNEGKTYPDNKDIKLFPESLSTYIA